MSRNKAIKKSNIASIVELFLMFLLLLIVIVVITMVCMTTREQSLYAHDLTEAVICAENTAEITSRAENAADAAEMITRMDGADSVTVDGNTVKATVNGYGMEVTLTPSRGSAGVYVEEDISVYHGGREAIYELHTGNYNQR